MKTKQPNRNNVMLLLDKMGQTIPSATLARIYGATKGMYNGAILGVPCRINDEVKERKLIMKDLSSLI